MSYRLEIDARAERQLKKLTPDKRAIVRPHILALPTQPHPSGAVRLKGSKHNGWRIRIGKLRVLYIIDETTRTVTVYDIDSRDSVYHDRG